MAPFNQSEVKLMQDVATLKSEVSALHEWRKHVDQKDAAQDRALYKLETEVHDGKRDLALIIRTGQSNSKKLKALLTIVLIPALDAAGWNTWKYFGEFLKPYVSRDFFYLIITTLMLLALIFAGKIALNSWKEKEDGGTGTGSSSGE